MKKNIIYLLLIIFSTFLNANEKVVLQLKWFHQFQFAGYIIAKEKGFYKDIGLNVKLKEFDSTIDVIKELVQIELLDILFQKVFLQFLLLVELLQAK